MKIIKFTLLGILCLLLIGCRKEEVTMTIKEGTLTPNGATIIIKDKENHTYGEAFSIERKEDNKWKKQEPIIEDYFFNLIGYTPNEKNEVEIKTDWQWLYGTLPPGTYRILKEGPNGEELITVFEIE